MKGDDHCRFPASCGVLPLLRSGTPFALCYALPLHSCLAAAAVGCRCTRHAAHTRSHATDPSPCLPPPCSHLTGTSGSCSTAHMLQQYPLSAILCAVQLPDCYFWELQYRPLIAGQPPGHWETLEVGQTMEVTVTGLEPGTRYAFRQAVLLRCVVLAALHLSLRQNACPTRMSGQVCGGLLVCMQPCAVQAS